MPALFVHGEKDDFILPAHSERLCEQYAGEKNRILVQGGREGRKQKTSFFFDNQSSGHNTVRPQFMRDSASIFFAQCMNLELVDAPPDFSLPVGLNTIESEGYCLFFFDLLRLSFPP